MMMTEQGTELTMDSITNEPITNEPITNEPITNEPITNEEEQKSLLKKNKVIKREKKEKKIKSPKKEKEIKVKKEKEIKVKKEKEIKPGLKTCFSDNEQTLEIGVDEAGRGPMLGRVYAAAVILPKDTMNFDHSLMKDSKKFHSDKKIKEVAEYIKSKAIAWAVGYSTEQVIDKINIRNATHRAMHEAIREVIHKQASEDPHVYHLLIDGNDFTPFNNISLQKGFVPVPSTCIEGGDNTYSAIAAASILAKVARDTYIEELCKEQPLLDEQYGILKNKGYGTKIHMDGIKQHGISEFHRKSFGICKQYA